MGKFGFTGKVGLMGIGCTITLTLNLLFTGILSLLFSAFLGTGVFHGKEFFVRQIGAGAQLWLGLGTKLAL